MEGFDAVANSLGLGVRTTYGGEEGLFKNVPHLCKRYVLLNKADSAEIEQHAKNIIREFKKISFSVQTFIISSMLTNSISVIS